MKVDPKEISKVALVIAKEVELHCPNVSMALDVLAEAKHIILNLSPVIVIDSDFKEINLNNT